MKQRFHLMIYLLVATVLIQGCASSSSPSSGAREEKPKYAPGREKHRNRTDEIGRKQGQWVFYNTFGEKISEIDFVNNQKEGIERKFYGYDRVREETEYLAGVREGTYTKYFFSSQVQLEGAYKDGKKDGRWTKYFEDGSIRQEGDYKEGKRNGEWKTYNRKGSVISTVVYKDGVNLADIEAQKKKEEEAKKAAAAKEAAKKKEPVIIKKGQKPPIPVSGEKDKDEEN